MSYFNEWEPRPDTQYGPLIWLAAFILCLILLMFTPVGMAHADAAEFELSAPVASPLSPNLMVSYGSLLDVHFSSGETSFSFEWNDIQASNMIIFENAQAPIFGFELGVGEIGKDAWVTLNALPGYGGFHDVWMTSGSDAPMQLQFGPQQQAATGTPEASTCVMLLLGFLFLGYTAHQRRPSRHAIHA